MNYLLTYLLICLANSIQVAGEYRHPNSGMYHGVAIVWLENSRLSVRCMCDYSFTFNYPHLLVPLLCSKFPHCIQTAGRRCMRRSPQCNQTDGDRGWLGTSVYWHQAFTTEDLYEQMCIVVERCGGDAKL